MKQNIFRQSFERPNLSYSVFEVDSKINKIIEMLKKVPGSAIIYCKSRKTNQRNKRVAAIAEYFCRSLSCRIDTGRKKP